MEIKTEYDSEEEGIRIGTCTNCCAMDKAENLLRRLLVKTEDEPEDSGTTVHDAAAVIYGSELLRFDCNSPVLCLDCCEILTQLYFLYIKFKDRNQNGSDVEIAIARARDRGYVLNTFQEQARPRVTQTTEYLKAPSLDRRNDSRLFKKLQRSEHKHNLTHRRDLRRKLCRRGRHIITEKKTLSQPDETQPIKSGAKSKSPQTPEECSTETQRCTSNINTDLTHGAIDSARNDAEQGCTVNISLAEETASNLEVNPTLPETTDVSSCSSFQSQSPTEFKKDSRNKSNLDKLQNPKKGPEIDCEDKVDPESTSKSASSTSAGDRRPGRPPGSKNGVSYRDSKSKKHICPHCGKEANTARNIYLHIRGVHEGQRPYVCSSCPKRFAGNDGLANHMRVFHADSSTTTDVKPFVCPVDGCGKSFSYRSSLFGHAMVHDRQLWKFECNICNRKCKSSNELSVHQASHSDDKNFACEDCGVLFKRRMSLKKHQHFLHPEKYGGEAVTKLTCHICQKKFLTPGNMRQHIRSIHEKIKPHQCCLCEKFFSCTGNLKVHLKGFHSLQGADLATEFSKCRILPTSSEVDMK